MPRFMMLMIPKLTPETWTPTPAQLEVMGKYNDELRKAGVLLDMEGLHSDARAARVSFPGGKPTVTDGPFAEAKEVIGGYWIIQAKSMEEAVEWACRVPVESSTPGGDAVVEVRQVFERADFPADARAALEKLEG